MTKKGCYVTCFAVEFGIPFCWEESWCDMENWLDLGVLLPLWLTDYLTLPLSLELPVFQKKWEEQ